MERRTEDELIEHLLANSILDEETGCVLWQGSVAGKGYGVTCWQAKQVYIHRIVYQFMHLNEEMKVIRHSCDTPNCWRIDHLFNGTTQDNVDDKINKKRHVFGSASHNASFRESQIIEIRNSPLNLYQLGEIYKVTPSTIHYIRARKTWKHVE